ncbi:hypothetical protein [Amaricoccus solimangrovi]|uniref:Uncharacterized protein n=1 Tax=Amaricoccus solimangrovi TaxID=2589815 RepID=A0A501WYF4_9RHOB|nr:hypothetical protein [Amaricoccus solimangrovi]TPE53802.1 hypothetical protein FJM51_01790 [Amaricoccus solimangrovi]
MRPAAALRALGLAAGLLAPLPGAAQDLVDRLLAKASAACAYLDGGEMTAPEGTVTRVDLTGDGVAEALVDESRLRCSTAASAYCGSGGCALHAVVGDRVTSWQATGWRLIDWGEDRILLIGRDGGWCGGIGAERCYEAVVWSDGRFLSVAPPDAGQPGQIP